MKIRFIKNPNINVTLKVISKPITILDTVSKKTLE
jgi:hypothetical protein